MNNIFIIIMNTTDLTKIVIELDCEDRRRREIMSGWFKTTEFSSFMVQSQ